MKTLNDERVQRETVPLLKYVADQENTEEMLAWYLKTVLARKDVIENLAHLEVNGVVLAVADPYTHKIFKKFASSVVMNAQVRDGLFENTVYAPMRKKFNVLSEKEKSEVQSEQFAKELDQRRSTVTME